jgi:hypothetical protein
LESGRCQAADRAFFSSSSGLIDAKGQVAGHGFLSKVLEKFGVDRLIPPNKEETSKP